MRNAILVGAAVALVLSASASHAQGASFEGLGRLPGGVAAQAWGVSGDGAVVVGASYQDGEWEAFRWTEATGIVGLGFIPGGSGESVAHDVSADGVVIVGHSWNAAQHSEAFRRTQAGGIVSLGSLPQFDDLFAEAVSADGSVIVGRTNGGAFQPLTAFRWTEAGGFQLLGGLPSGHTDAEAYGVSADGNVIVGGMTGNPGAAGEAFRWTTGGGFVGLGDLPGGGFSSGAMGVSADGEVVVGYGEGPLGQEAFRWTQAGGMVSLNDGSSATTARVAYGVSADGAVIVGGSGVALLWTAGDGVRVLKDVLEDDYGLDLTGWTLAAATAVSPDGTVVVGYGTNPQGEEEAWRAMLLGQCDAEAFTAVRFWDDPAGGSFADPSNWVDGELPGTSDAAAFQFPDGTNYTVGFAADQTNDALSVEGGNDVNLSLGGRAYTLSGASSCRPSVTVGGPGGSSSVLTVAEGTLSALAGLTVAGGQATALSAAAGGSVLAIGTLSVASDLATHGEIRAQTGGQFTLASTTPIIIGGAGTGAISVDGGSQGTVGGPVHVASLEGGFGIVRVHGAGSQLTTNGIIEVGLRGNGNLFAGDLAALEATTVVLGRDGVGEFTLFPFGFAQVTDLWAGVNGGGGVWVMAGGRLTAGNAFVPGGPGDGAVGVDGPGAEFRANALRLGGPGTGRLNVINGGCARVGVYSQLQGGTLNTPTGTFQMGNANAPCPPPQVGADNFIVADSAWIGTGTVLDSVTVILAGGILGGGGTLAVDLTNAGTINPGDSAGVAGTFTIGGAYAQDAAGVLEAELAGTTSHDVLSVTGAATLDGVLRFRYVGGFTPAPGDAFEILTAGSVVGEFGSVEGPAGSTYSIDYGPTTVTASVLTVPTEPAPRPAGLVLHPPAPNPSSGSVSIRYELPAAGPVRLTVYDALGREVALLADGERPAGLYDAALNAGRLAPGTYVARLITTAATEHRTLTVLE